MKKSKANVAERVNQAIIDAMKSGVCPWRLPWSRCKVGAAANAVTGHEYSGVNVWLTMIAMLSGDYQAPLFLTYKQAQSVGAQVRKGSKGSKIVYAGRIVKEKDEQDRPTRVVPFMKLYTVFNVAQVDDLPAAYKPEPAEVFDHDPDARCEQIVASMPDKPAIEHGAESAAYLRSFDQIRMPDLSRFESPAAYYLTLFHELAHATGAPHRLNREQDRTTAKAKATEELIAELAASYVLAQSGQDLWSEQQEQAAAYIDNWIGRFEQWPDLFMHAASKAQAAADCILGRSIVGDKMKHSAAAASA